MKKVFNNIHNGIYLFGIRAMSTMSRCTPSINRNFEKFTIILANVSCLLHGQKIRVEVSMVAHFGDHRSFNNCPRTHHCQ